jgi:DeoR/GlpR family transcriptional regulator of sugar metabolism
MTGTPVGSSATAPASHTAVAVAQREWADWQNFEHNTAQSACFSQNDLVSAIDRHRLIVEQLGLHDRVSVGDLAELAGTSEMTIRRDLEQLESRGALRRVHGGAVNVALGGADLPYGIRELTNIDAKERIGKAAADTLLNGETVILDTGSTTVAIAKAMVGRQLTVTPLSLHSLFELTRSETIKLLLPGGQVRAGELSIVGNATEAAFTDFSYDTFIIGCCGIDAKNGATAVDLEDVRVKRAAIRASSRRIAVATAEKLSRVTLARICPAEDIDLLITDAPDDASTVARLRDSGMSVLCV